MRLISRINAINERCGDAMNDWRTRLEAVLVSKKVKRTHFAVELGFSRDYVTRLLKPDSNPSLRDLERVCDALGVSFVYIYTGRDEDQIYDNVIREVSKMDENDLRSLRDHLKNSPLSSEPD